MANATIPAAWFQNDAHDLAIIGALRQAGVAIDFIRNGVVYVNDKPTGKLVSKVSGATATLSVETLPLPAPASAKPAVVETKPPAVEIKSAAAKTEQAK